LGGREVRSLTLAATNHHSDPKPEAREQQKARRRGPAGKKWDDGRLAKLDGFRKLGWLQLLNGGKIVSAHLIHVVALTQHAIEFVDQQRNGLVAFVGLNFGVEIGALDLDMAFGFEPGRDRFLRVALQFHAKPDDPLLVTKQSIGFLSNEVLQRRSQFEVDA
jgi:hypothetical protein